MRIAGRRLAVDEALGAAAAALVSDDDRLVDQLVLVDDRLDRAREVVRAAARSGRDDELDRLATASSRPAALGRADSDNAPAMTAAIFTDLFRCFDMRGILLLMPRSVRSGAVDAASRRSLRAPRRAMRAASSSAARVAPTLAMPWPAMSYAVPCAGVQIGNGKPPISVTPRSKPISFIAIWPWS